MSGARPQAPALTGVLETALYVADLDRAEAFYARLLGARTLLAEADRMRALDVAGRQVLLLFRCGASDAENPVPGGVVPPHDARGRIHLCFAIPADALDAWEAHLAALGVAVESRVRAERGATCLYVRDPDGHLVELATPGLWETY
ncbi:VOC family protein [Roseisolibacter sp. H3M3-2]|uniref:VOC family protein n=1 Tax=Roseisolibacter sp. H3M3-2 TaxID=3031323 RepID=UPI0023D98AD9|nr:VOC family protein [Roseisolibacter sp. H3M3-2]MDF1504602.1 VOC family protein [Roseisolibacter sp. H3M3-2]